MKSHINGIWIIIFLSACSIQNSEPTATITPARTPIPSATSVEAIHTPLALTFRYTEKIDRARQGWISKGIGSYEIELYFYENLASGNEMHRFVTVEDSQVVKSSCIPEECPIYILRNIYTIDDVFAVAQGSSAGVKTADELDACIQGIQFHDKYRFPISVSIDCPWIADDDHSIRVVSFAPEQNNSPEPTLTHTPTSEPTATITPTPTATKKPTATLTVAPSDTPLPTDTATPEPTKTPLPSPTWPPTEIPEPTRTLAPTMEPTVGNNQNSIASACVVSTDSTYGYSPDNPIRVGGDAFGGPPRERAYLDSLSGPNGEAISYYREGSIYYVDTILDIYHVSYDGSNSVVLYIDEYSYQELMAPVGFVCWTPIPLSAP